MDKFNQIFLNSFAYLLHRMVGRNTLLTNQQYIYNSYIWIWNRCFLFNYYNKNQNHDAKLLKSIANLKDGNFYYIETLEIANECFVDALGGLISVIAQNVKLSCKLIKHAFFSDIRISKTYGNWQLNEETQEYYIIINQLLGGVTKDNVFEINIPPIKKQLQENQKNLDILSLKQIIVIKERNITKDLVFQ
eukprot:TRINITY_DN5441_c0_g1_i8.p1 TRINITY_DN5441_c0_g1~~TRINITY_DN5441_c0_g1_i8.p1  ORF type:complete len:191 (+),score=8.29 TRINITY_DN5441_c0_g1_i8:38-610(+)